MAIRIDAHELIELLRLTPPEQNVLLIGKHGIGKSEIITHFYRNERNLPVISFFLGQMSDPGDLIGLLHKDEQHGRSVFLPPYWWPVDARPVVLFLDELNRARPELLQAIQDLTLNRTLAGRTLPVGSIIIAAINEGEEYQLTDLDPALVSRFNLYEFAPTIEEWLIWAAQHSLDSRVMAFIQKYPEHLDSIPASAEEAGLATGLIKTPDRRAWAKVAAFIAKQPTLDDIHIKIIAGMVGSKAALAFRQSLGVLLIVTVEQILLTFSNYRTKLKNFALQDFINLNEQILLYLQARRYPQERAVDIRKNLLAYLKHIKRNGENEAIAHFASLVEKPQFEKALGMLAESVELITFMTDYIQGIRVT